MILDYFYNYNDDHKRAIENIFFILSTRCVFLHSENTYTYGIFNIFDIDHVISQINNYECRINVTKIIINNNLIKIEYIFLKDNKKYNINTNIIDYV